ncbi:YacL family protein [Thalassotalea sp. Y01]|uniref:YacL family protein n=1 Tax=Thalassotalea sp. Y01 TaxID=2729613 RepID=UPI00145E52D7|nr:YacL family protein [Thalassotalea sp. Y01]NMP15812.1 YacL family protein [Thalassotalea sp. Y01]
MDYQFTLDFINGQPRAEFNLEHHVFGPWLESEIGTDQSKFNAVQALVNASETRSDKQQLNGKEYSLSIEEGEATVFANIICSDEDLPERLIDDVDNFDMNQTASCGVEDLLEMLSAWHQFW